MDGANEEEGKRVKEAADTGKRFKEEVGPERGVKFMEESGKGVKEILGGNTVRDGNPADGVRVNRAAEVADGFVVVVRVEAAVEEEGNEADGCVVAVLDKCMAGMPPPREMVSWRAFASFSSRAEGTTFLLLKTRNFFLGFCSSVAASSILVCSEC